MPGSTFQCRISSGTVGKEERGEQRDRGAWVGTEFDVG